jgi:replicative DNA helicase
MPEVLSHFLLIRLAGLFYPGTTTEVPKLLDDDFERVKGNISLTAFCDSHGMERRGRDTYVCPACGSGNGKSRTAAFKVFDDSRWTCFSCHKDGDVFDLAGILNGTDDRNEQLQSVASWAGMEAREGDGVAKPKPVVAHKPPEPKPDYTAGRERERAFIKVSRAHVSDPEARRYLEGRGITPELAESWNLGYDPTKKRIVIPFPGADWYHVDRDILDRYKTNPIRYPKYRKPKKDEAGPQPVWNEKAMDEPVYFIVEGPLDALAVQECGYPSVAFCSTGDRKYIEAAKRHKGIAVLMLDNDDPGRNGQARLATDLRGEGVEVHEVVCKSPTDYLGKDAFEAFVSHKDDDRFTNLLAEETQQANKEAEERRKEKYCKAFEDLCIRDPVEVVGDLFVLKNAKEHISTGLKGIDEALEGGFSQGGLTTLGAMSSTGKTTLAVQIADNMAASGHPVLFVTIEQSADEIVSKSVSRFVREIPRHNGGWLTISSDKMLSMKERARWLKEDPDKAEAFEIACERYGREVAPNLRIMEGIEQPDTLGIRSAAEIMKEQDKEHRSPLVFIDYLQLIKSPDEHLSDKQAVDRNVIDLRHMARDLKTCVVVISSLNRASYSCGVTLDSFKESGAIEYGSDVLMGLQPRGMRDRLKSLPEAKQKREADSMIDDFKRRANREAEVVVLKVRNGPMPKDCVPLSYDAVSNRFTDDPATETGRKKDFDKIVAKVI